MYNKYNINSKSTEQIDISVLNVSQHDGGIYQSVSLSARPNGCCLLIITGLYIMFYFFIFKKYMWRNEFFGLSNYFKAYGVLKSEEILRTCKTTRPVHRKTTRPVHSSSKPKQKGTRTDKSIWLNTKWYECVNKYKMYSKYELKIPRNLSKPNPE